MAAYRSFAWPWSFAPFRAKSSWISHTRRFWSGRSDFVPFSYTAWMRAKSFWFCVIFERNSESFGAIACWIFRNSGDERFELQIPQYVITRSSSRPARSMATTVFSNVGGSGLFAMASISSRFIAMPDSRPGCRDSRSIRSNAGTPP